MKNNNENKQNQNSQNQQDQQNQNKIRIRSNLFQNHQRRQAYDLPALPSSCPERKRCYYNINSIYVYSSKDAQSGNEVSGMKMLVLSDSHGNVREHGARSGAGAARPHRPLGRRYVRR